MKPAIKIRTSKQGLMGLASRVHKPKQGMGSYRRHDRIRKDWLDKSHENE